MARARTNLFAVLGFTTMILSTSVATADTVTIGASRDATIYQNDPNNSNGAGFTMFAGDNGMRGSGRRRYGPGIPRQPG